MKTQWYYISLYYATFGIRTTDNIVDITAPIGKWMKGKPISEISGWVKRKHGKILKI